MFGFINLNKPSGFTSHDCVAKTRRLLNTKKVGHGGTLDPLATGVLPIAVGKATRLLQFLPEKKAYRARIRLGVQTTTDDLEGEAIATTKVNNINEEDIIDYLKQFKGEIEQIPPVYSAIKQKGQKLYQLARAGIEVEVPTRKVTIYSCELVNIFGGEFPEVEIDVSCGAGTYIRAIARDLGEMLGVGGTLAKLIRTQSCSLKLENSISFETIENELQNECFQLIKPDELLSHLMAVTLNHEDSKRWCNGQSIDISHKDSLQDLFTQVSTKEQLQYLRVYSQEQKFLGIAIAIERDNIAVCKPKIVCTSFD